MLGKDRWKFGLKRRNILFFQGFRREYVQIVPKWLGGPQLHIFGPKISLGYKTFWGKFENNAF